MDEKRHSTSESQTSPKRKPRQSPLFRSAVEVLEHGLYHFFNSDTSTDMKFALLHVDQSVELFLKDLVLARGRSIYREKSKETIGTWEALRILEKDLGCSIPENPNLELLHEERNNIQHNFANPSVEDTAFHLENAVLFLQRFLRDESGIDLADHLPAQYLDQLVENIQ